MSKCSHFGKRPAPAEETKAHRAFRWYRRHTKLEPFKLGIQVCHYQRKWVALKRLKLAPSNNPLSTASWLQWVVENFSRSCLHSACMRVCVFNHSLEFPRSKTANLEVKYHQTSLEFHAHMYDNQSTDASAEFQSLWKLNDGHDSW